MFAYRPAPAFLTLGVLPVVLAYLTAPAFLTFRAHPVVRAYRSAPAFLTPGAAPVVRAFSRHFGIIIIELPKTLRTQKYSYREKTIERCVVCGWCVIDFNAGMVKTDS